MPYRNWKPNKYGNLRDRRFLPVRPQMRPLNRSLTSPSRFRSALGEYAPLYYANQGRMLWERPYRVSLGPSRLPVEGPFMRFGHFYSK